MTIIKIACRRYFLRNSGVIIPTLVRKKVRIGSSKISPVARQIEVKEPMYDLMLIWFTTSGLIS